MQPVPPGAEEEAEAAEQIGDEAAAAAAADHERAVQITAERGPKGGMTPPTTAAWLRARFRQEILRRFKGGGGGGGGEGARAAAAEKSLTAIRVSFSLPLGAYATTLLQHVTGEGLLYGRQKTWHTSEGRGEQQDGGEYGGEEEYYGGGGVEEGEGEGDGERGRDRGPGPA